MKIFVKIGIKWILKKFELLFIPFIYISSYLFRFIKEIGIYQMGHSRNIFYKVGVYPITYYYYDPLFNPNHLSKSLRLDRELPGIDFNTVMQLDLLKNFNYNDELNQISLEKTNSLEFYYHNGIYESGDAEYLYNMIRYFKPKRIIEIGSGYSTRMAVTAVNYNKKEDPQYKCDHVCIEPFEMKDWLEKLNVTVIRQKVEEVDKSLFAQLSENDILFIDSTHTIRAQGDVLFEFQEIIPTLKKGTITHIHDIFTPKDYLDEWFQSVQLFYNEQYLLESFLAFNDKYEIIAALNYLKNNYFDDLVSKCPILKIEPHREPGSFWMRTKY